MVEEDVPRSIHDICEEGHEEEVMRLLDVDPGLVHVRNGYGSSPLLGCAWGGHLGLVKLLLCKVRGCLSLRIKRASIFTRSPLGGTSIE